MQRFLRLAGFLGQAVGTAEEQAKNFRWDWGLHKSILDHVMCIQFTDVAQVADAARNIEILRDRDDYDRSERSDKRQLNAPRGATEELRDLLEHMISQFAFLSGGLLTPATLSLQATPAEQDALRFPLLWTHL
ncbi:hypothetical protein Tco_0055023 [Tanacetum coccineum]